MVKIQLNLDDEEDKIVSIFKIENKLETKEESIKEIIRKDKKCVHKFELVSEKKGFIDTLTQRCVKCGLVKVDRVYSSGTIETTLSK